MLRLQSEADYRERRRELMALEEIVDDGVALIAKGRRQGELRPGIELTLEDFAEALVRLLDRHLDDSLTLRREALRLYEEASSRTGRGTPAETDGLLSDANWNIATKNLPTETEDPPHERSHHA